MKLGLLQNSSDGDFDTDNCLARFCITASSSSVRGVEFRSDTAKNSRISAAMLSEISASGKKQPASTFLYQALAVRFAEPM